MLNIQTLTSQNRQPDSHFRKAYGTVETGTSLVEEILLDTTIPIYEFREKVNK